jgi:hypothetical protein
LNDEENSHGNEKWPSKLKYPGGELVWYEVQGLSKNWCATVERDIAGQCVAHLLFSVSGLRFEVYGCCRAKIVFLVYGFGFEVAAALWKHISNIIIIKL